MFVSVCVSIEYNIEYAFNEIRMYDTMSGSQPMGQVELGA